MGCLILKKVSVYFKINFWLSINWPFKWISRKYIPLSTELFYFTENFYIMSIGNHIKKLRELRNYTQTYISTELEISVSAYSKIERDETEISLKRLNQIAKILKIHVNTILLFNEKSFIDELNANQGQPMVKKEIQNDQLIKQLRSEIEFLRTIIYKNQIPSNDE